MGRRPDLPGLKPSESGPAAPGGARLRRWPRVLAVVRRDPTSPRVASRRRCTSCGRAGGTACWAIGDRALAHTSRSSWFIRCFEVDSRNGMTHEATHSSPVGGTGWTLQPWAVVVNQCDRQRLAQRSASGRRRCRPKRRLPALPHPRTSSVNLAQLLARPCPGLGREPAPVRHEGRQLPRNLSGLSRVPRAGALMAPTTPESIQGVDATELVTCRQRSKLRPMRRSKTRPPVPWFLVCRVLGSDAGQGVDPAVA
jgi:hypothetical protein